MTPPPQSAHAPGASANAPGRGTGLAMPRLLLRAILHRPAKLFTVIAALGVGATLASAFLSLYFDLPARMNSEFRALGPNILITPAEANLAAPSSGQLGAQGVISNVPNVIGEQSLATARAALANTSGGPGPPSAPGAEALPWLYAVGQVNGKSLVLAGTDLNRIAKVHPSWRITLASPFLAPVATQLATEAVMGDTSDGAIAGERAAAQHGWSETDSEQQWVSVIYAGAEHQLPLRGIVSTGGAIDDQLILALPALQQITGHAGLLSAIEIAAPGDNAQVEQSITRLQAALGAAPNGPHHTGATAAATAATVQPLRPVLKSQAGIILKIRGLMFGLTGVVLALVLLSVMTTISGLVLDRSREIGVMKALGGGNARILRLLMAEASLLALVAALGGYFAGFALARMAARHIFASGAGAAGFADESALLALRGDVFAAVVGITVAVALAACALPAQQMKRIDPAVALRGE